MRNIYIDAISQGATSGLAPLPGNYMYKLLWSYDFQYKIAPFLFGDVRI